MVSDPPLLFLWLGGSRRHTQTHVAKQCCHEMMLYICRKPWCRISRADRAEFGNYIGADLDSGEESDDFDVGQTSAAGPSGGVSGGVGAGGDFAPLEGLEDGDDEDEDMEEREGAGMEMTLHGVDGE